MVRINNKEMAKKYVDKISKGKKEAEIKKQDEKDKKIYAEEVGKRMKEFLKEKFVMIKIGAEKLGVLDQSLQVYFTGRSLPGGEMLRKLANQGADVHYILTGERMSEKVRKESNQIKSKGGNNYPLVSRLSAGNMIEFFDTEKSEAVAFNYYKKNGCMALVVSGDSMNPTIENGDIVLVDGDAKIYDGCIVAARLKSGEQLIKRFRKLPQDLIQLDSDNFLYDPITLNRDEIEILMPVVRVQRDIYKKKGEN